MPLAFLGATVENVRCTFLWQQGGVASLPVAPQPSVPSVPPVLHCTAPSLAWPVRARLLRISPIPASRTLVTCIPRPSCRLRCHTTWPPSGAARATTPLRYANTLVRAHTRPLDRQTVLPWTQLLDTTWSHHPGRTALRLGSIPTTSSFSAGSTRPAPPSSRTFSPFLDPSSSTFHGPPHATGHRTGRPRPRRGRDQPSTPLLASALSRSEGAPLASSAGSTRPAPPSSRTFSPSVPGPFLEHVPRATSGHLGPPRATSGHLGPPRATSGHIGPHRATAGRLGPPHGPPHATRATAWAVLDFASTSTISLRRNRRSPPRHHSSSRPRPSVNAAFLCLPLASDTRVTATS